MIIVGKHIRHKLFFLILIATISTYFVSVSIAQVVKDEDPALKNIDIVEQLGKTIPMDVVLVNDAGKQTTIGEYFDGEKPVVIVMAYYTCPMLCNLVLNGLAETATDMEWSPGEQYRILTVSIDPTETAPLARAKKANYFESMGKPEAETGWTFFTGDGSESKRLADAIGFKYYFDEDLQQYAHAAAIYVLTGDGKISRYLYGIEFKQRDLKLALLEASEGKVGNTLDRILLYCYHYDPNAGGYVAFATNIMKLGGVVTLVVLGGLLGFFWIRELRKRKARIRESNV